MAYFGHISIALTYKGFDFDFEVYGTVDQGGSTSWGSDEPPWFDVELDDIYCGDKKISDRLYEKLMNLHEDKIREAFQAKYL
jgi:hypothetical protein